MTARFGVREGNEDAVYITDLLAAITGDQSRFGRYAVRAATLEGRRYERSLVTDVRNRPDSLSETLTVPLGKRFRIFRVTVGRDPSETAAGPGCVYFEAWGDERRLFISQALRSPAHLVKVGPGAGGKVRRTPQDLGADVRGIETLRLVTRYADDFAQEAPQVEQARGCVWGDPRLEPDAEAEHSTAALSDNALRDALRGPALRLAVAVAGKLDPTTTLPLKLAAAPLRLEGPVLAGPGEATLRGILTELLAGARRGGDILFTPVGRRESDRLARDFPARRPERAEPDELQALTDAAKRANADVALTGIYAPAAAGQAGRLTLMLLDVRSGTRLGGSTAVLPAR